MTNACRALLALFLLPALVHAQDATPSGVLGGTVDRIGAMIQPPADAPARTFVTRMKITRADGLPKEALGATLDLAFQAPDKLRLTAVVKNENITVGRHGQSLWFYNANKKWGVVGSSDVPKFSTNPRSTDRTPVPPFTLPINPTVVKFALFGAESRMLPGETIENNKCHVVRLTLPAVIQEMFKLPPGTAELAIRQADSLPARIRYSDGRVDFEAMFEETGLRRPFEPAKWSLTPSEGDNIEKTAAAHLVRFLEVGAQMLNNKIPTLGSATGEVKLVARSGNGRLEMHDGTRVLFLKGTPAELGRQHGELLRKEIRDVTHRILYGVGVGSSFVKGKWFFGEIEQAHARLAPFISPRMYAESDALADAVGLSRDEVRLANFFPELFHCSGFAITGAATKDGRVYHGRVLDYLRGMGLEQNAVVMVIQPDEGNAWVNVGYSGFIGSVTAMNARHISIGEMGGRGEGNWDGKPMAQLMREVMEKAGTLDEAVEIMRKGPRTCEYYYVIADGKSKKAVGIKATPTIFEVVRLGESHPQLTRPVPDTVLLSAGDRYNHLVDRVKAGYGSFDGASARALMDPPVCMKSNIQSVLFAPDTLDFWVANADSKNVASQTRYTHYNLADLLKSDR